MPNLHRTKQLLPEEEGRKFLVFTGHQDRLTTPEFLAYLDLLYGDHIWMNGGAQGFDTQVQEYAERRSINTRQVFARVFCELYGKTIGPLRRNDHMLLYANHLVALYDGRTRGGTLYTVNRAKEQHIPITYAPLSNVIPPRILRMIQR